MNLASLSTKKLAINLFLLNILDCITTHAAIAAGAIEINPLWNWLLTTQPLWVFYVTKILLVTILLLLLLIFQKTWPRLINLSLLIVLILFSAAVINNAILMWR